MFKVNATNVVHRRMNVFNVHMLHLREERALHCSRSVLHFTSVYMVSHDQRVFYAPRRAKVSDVQSDICEDFGQITEEK